MALDSSNPRHSTGVRATSVSDSECRIATERFAGKGWNELDEMASKLGWRHSRLTAVLRWLRRESPIYVVETKVSRGIVKVRITESTLDTKQARQLSSDIITQLAKLYSNLRHTDRHREKLAYDVRTIACRIAPFLESREFQIQYRRFKRQLNVPQQEIQMEAGAESPDLPIEPARSRSTPSVSKSGFEGPRFATVDRHALRRVTLIATIIIVGLLITIFLTTSFLHAMEILTQYVERINADAPL